MRVSTGSNDAPREASVGKSINPENWNSRLHRATGSGQMTRLINSHLEAVERNVEQVHAYFVRHQIEITAEAILDKYLGKDDIQRFLLAIFRDHNEKMKASIGKGFKANTLKGYISSVNHLSEFIQSDFHSDDIQIKKIDHAFILGYEFFLRTVKGISDVSTAKYMKHFRKIINLCLAHKWIEENPFVFYKNKSKPRDKEFLTKDEMKRITEKQFTIPRLDLVRDIFVFSCFTGLSYADIKKLKKSDIRKGDDDNQWIFTTREKNDNSSNIPLLDVPLKLISKYRSRPECKIQGFVLPVLSNQKMNSYLKEIADCCGITKTITFHIARHTFATTITLSNNVPIETVSKMLGHKDIRTTQHYAKVLDQKVGNDMRELNNKLRKSA
ncbi:MAG: site-specific integrase, partial [Flavobacterium sp.]